MHISEQGIKLLIEREAARTHAYLDSVGVWTIGVGHTGPEVHEGLVWTDEQVKEAFHKDIARFEDAVNSAHAAFEPHQFDALVSFAFNVGTGAFKSSTMLRLINEGKMDEVPAQFDRWHIPPEITSRRNGEKHQFIGDRFEARIP
jgi:lysozyme